jgi:hypothetical protein
MVSQQDVSTAQQHTTLESTALEAEQPPLFRTWTGWYALVVSVFVGFVLACWAFSQAFQ